MTSFEREEILETLSKHKYNLLLFLFYLLLFLIEFYYALIFYLQNLVNDNNSKGEEDLRIFFGDGIFILDLLFFIIFIFRYFLELFLTFIELIILFLLDILFFIIIFLFDYIRRMISIIYI